MRVIHASHQGPGQDDSTARDWLEISRGRTQFPHRPLSSNRILIGSGTNCHLQLGGHMPVLHSLLLRGVGGWRLDVIAPEPAIFVNGEGCRHRELSIGDRIQLAEFEFVLCRSEKGVPRSKSGGPHQQQDAADSIQAETGRLSATELLERMEQEMIAVEEFERGRRNGARALLEAASTEATILRFRDRQQTQHRRAA